MPFFQLTTTTAQAAPAVTLGAPLTEVGETLTTFQEDLSAELAQRVEIVSDLSWLTKRINRGYQYLAGMLHVNALFDSFPITLAVSQPFYILPGNVSFVREVTIQDTVNYLQGGRQLKLIDEKYYRQLDDLTDEPTSWFRTRGNMLVVWPTPKVSRTIIVDVRVIPQNLRVETDSPILPIPLHESIFLAARYRALRDLKDYAAAAVANNDFVTQTRPLLNADAEEKSKQVSTLRPVRTLAELYRRRR